MARTALAAALLLATSAASAAEYRLPTSTGFPHAKLTPVNSSRTLCSTWADPIICNVTAGRQYVLHRWSADWSRSDRSRITIAQAPGTRSVASLMREIRDLRLALRECRGR